MTDEGREAWRKACEDDFRRASDFLSEANPGDTYRIEKYILVETGIPCSLTRHADRHEKKTVTVHAVHEDAGWFTTTSGEAMDARSLIRWEKVPKQTELFG